VDKDRFLTHWFSGLLRGLEGIDAPARTAILRRCGQACADSYTAAIFQETRAQSSDLAGFLALLAARFPEATYELLAPRTIRVCYDDCACDLVRRGWVRSPLLCECSAHNLQENFERTWGLETSVSLEASILAGAPRCIFLVSLAGPPEALDAHPLGGYTAG
jgi:hypothetical protein